MGTLFAIIIMGYYLLCRRPLQNIPFLSPFFPGKDESGLIWNGLLQLEMHIGGFPHGILQSPATLHWSCVAGPQMMQSVACWRRWLRILSFP